MMVSDQAKQGSTHLAVERSEIVPPPRGVEERSDRAPSRSRVKRDRAPRGAEE